MCLYKIIHQIFKLFFVLLVLLNTIITNAQEDFYLNIPDSLNYYTNAIILDDKTNIKLVSPHKMIISVKQKILIKNKHADFLAHLALNYDKFTKILSVNTNFYNLENKLVKRIRKKDLKDIAASMDNTLYSDNRLKIYEHIPHNYPYIVEKKYEISTQNTAFIPPWQPIPDYNISVINSEYNFYYPKHLKIYKAENQTNIKNIKKTEKPGFIQYKANFLKPIKPEPLSPPFSKLTPSVRLAVNEFELAGVSGSANNWNEFGQWMSKKLLEGKNKLNPSRVKEIKKMVAGISDPVERAKIIYEYVQNKTRYINIAIGIGGWQPMSATEVDKLGYGDCKALTYYTKTLMDIAQVPAIYTLVYAGTQPKNINEDLIALQGNHAFLCLPQKNDTIWLECTSQKVPFGFINSFTDDRKVITITPNKTKIVKTKTYKPEDNLQTTEATIQVKENGDIKAIGKITSFGSQYNKHLEYFDGISPEKLKENFAYYFDYLKNIEFKKLTVTNNKHENKFVEEFELTSNNYAYINPEGNMILQPNIFNRNTYVPKKIKNRQTDFVINRGYKDVDEYTYLLPQSFTITQLPAPKIIENQFGKYQLIYEKLNNQSFKYKRTFILNKGTYPKEQYNQYRKFRKKIKKIELQKILINKT